MFSATRISAIIVHKQDRHLCAALILPVIE